MLFDSAVELSTSVIVNPKKTAVGAVAMNGRKVRKSDVGGSEIVEKPEKTRRMTAMSPNRMVLHCHQCLLLTN